MIIKGIKLRELNKIGEFILATSFDGVNEYINMGNDASLDWSRTEPLSMFVWYNKKGGSALGNIANKYDLGGTEKGFSWQLTGTGKPYILLRSGIGSYIQFNGSLEISDNDWHLLGITYDGSSDATGVDLWIDNVVQTKISITNSIGTGTTNNTNEFKIGEGRGGYLQGALSHFSMYDKELTSGEVTTIYNEGYISPDYSSITNLVSHWKLDRLNPIDEQGTNNGTSVNMDVSNLIRI